MLLQLGLPYWSAEGVGRKARWKLAGVFALTLGTTGVRSFPELCQEQSSKLIQCLLFGCLDIQTSCVAIMEIHANQLCVAGACVRREVQTHTDPQFH